MKWLQRVFDFYLDASIHVALAVFSLVGCTCVLFNIPLPKALAFFLFFGSIACYNFMKYGVEAEKYYKLVNRYHRSIQIFSLFCLGIATYFCFYLERETWLGLLVLLALTGLYAIPILPGTKNLRSWGGIKVFLVALVWAGATVVLPIMESYIAWSWDASISVVQRFLLVFVLLVPFEIRDLAYDGTELRTLPQRYGVRGAKRLGFIGAFLLVLLLFGKDTVSQVAIFGTAALTLMLLCCLLATRKTQHRYFAAFFVEAVPICWYLVLRGADYFLG